MFSADRAWSCCGDNYLDTVHDWNVTWFNSSWKKGPQSFVLKDSLKRGSLDSGHLHDVIIIEETKNDAQLFLPLQMRNRQEVKPNTGLNRTTAG